MSDPIEVVELEDGVVGKIYHDDCVSNPYEDDESVRIVILSRRYSDPAKGACGKTMEEVEDWRKENEEEWVSFPLWAYEHGNIVYQVSGSNPFNCPWDSAQAGILALKKDDMGGDPFEIAESIANGYSMWANGECYGYVLERTTDPCEKCGRTEVEELDACWGFIGMKDVEAEMKERAKDFERDQEVESR